MNIAICDDTKQDIENLINLASCYFDKNMITYNFDCYNSAENLLNNNKEHKYDLYFLDIFMKDITGIELAKVIRKTNDNCQIIFTTTSLDFALDSYKLSAIDYLIKPITYDKLSHSLNRCSIYFNDIYKYIELVIDKVTIKILLSAIIYIEVYNNTCIVHTNKRNIEVKYSLDSIESLLGGEPFLRCHRSYIVNMNYIVDMDLLNFIVSNNDKVPITLRTKTKIKQTYNDYLYKLANKNN